MTCSLSRVRLPATLLLCATSACVTVVPMQTASVVPRGAYRVGGATTVTGYCSVSLGPAGGVLEWLARGNPGRGLRGLDACNAIPLGLPTPELRLGGRHGIADGMDLGVSLEGEATLGRGYQLGTFLDLKKEAWTRPLDGGRRQLVSVAPGVGYTSVQITDRVDTPSIGVVDVALPVYFGHETGKYELVAGAKYVERFIFSDHDGDGRREMLADGDLGLSFGFFSRGTTKFGLELGYQSALSRPLGGLFNLSAGVTWDLGLPEPAAPAP